MCCQCVADKADVLVMCVRVCVCARECACVCIHTVYICALCWCSNHVIRTQRVRKPEQQYRCLGFRDTYCCSCLTVTQGRGWSHKRKSWFRVTEGYLEDDPTTETAAATHIHHCCHEHSRSFKDDPMNKTASVFFTDSGTILSLARARALALSLSVSVSVYRLRQRVAAYEPQLLKSSLLSLEPRPRF